MSQSHGRRVSKRGASPGFIWWNSGGGAHVGAPTSLPWAGERRSPSLRAVLHPRTNLLSEIWSLIRRYNAQRSYASMRRKARPNIWHFW